MFITQYERGPGGIETALRYLVKKRPLEYIVTRDSPEWGLTVNASGITYTVHRDGLFTFCTGGETFITGQPTTESKEVVHV